MSSTTAIYICACCQRIETVQDSKNKPAGWEHLDGHLVCDRCKGFPLANMAKRWGGVNG